MKTKAENSPQVKTTQGFIREIEELVEETKIDYIDAVLHYCEQNNIEIETAAAIIRISPKIKSRIQLEAENANVLPKTQKLPI